MGLFLSISIKIYIFVFAQKLENENRPQIPQCEYLGIGLHADFHSLPDNGQHTGKFTVP